RASLSRLRRPPHPPLFPYTTLFRSLSDLSVDAADTALRADALWSVGHFEEAAAAYSRALALAPNLAAANHGMARVLDARGRTAEDRKSTRLNSSHVKISYAVFCLKK